MHTMIDFALWYNAQSICVVPVKPRDKAVALPEWTQYQHRQSTTEEIETWWKRQPNANIGLVHGVNGYAAIDIDHDKGALREILTRFSSLAGGRVEQSGSGEGFHIPVFLGEYPDLGWDNSKSRPKGNHTWKTPLGDINIRARWCQTVAPPSIHPSGLAYRFVNNSAAARLDNLNDLIAWLNTYSPAPAPRVAVSQSSTPRNSDTDRVKSYYPDLVEVFRALGIVGEVVKDKGDTRICGHGGLSVKEGQWYCFTDEMGGDVVDAFGWVRYGTAWSRHNKRQFSEVIEDMRQRAGIGRERVLPITASRVRATLGVAGYWK